MGMEEPVDESPSSISTRDNGRCMGDSERDLPSNLSSRLMVSLELTVMVLTVVRSGRDWVCTICIRKGDMIGSGEQSSSQSFRRVAALCLSGLLGGIDGS